VALLCYHIVVSAGWDSGPFDGIPMQQKCWNFGHGHSYPTQKVACCVLSFFSITYCYNCRNCI